jgi:putative ABC transport system permease protein
MLTLAGVVLGTDLLYAGLALAQPLVDRAYGLHLAIDPPKASELMTLGAVVMAGILAGLLPALRAYRMSLADGMMVRT